MIIPSEEYLINIYVHGEPDIIKQIKVTGLYELEIETEWLRSTLKDKYYFDIIENY